MALLVTVNGKTPGDVYAIRPGGSGDVTKTHMAWHTPRTGNRDIPSPVAVGDYVFVVSMTGVASMYNATTGKEVWRERIGGNYSGTPFVANGLIYLLAEEGVTLVIRPGEKLDIVAKNCARKRRRRNLSRLADAEQRASAAALAVDAVLRGARSGGIGFENSKSRKTNDKQITKRKIQNAKSVLAFRT